MSDESMQDPTSGDELSKSKSGATASTSKNTATTKATNRVSDSALSPSKPNKNTSVDEIPATDVSLVCDDNKPRQIDKKPKFYTKLSYQIMLVLGLIGAFLLAIVYQTLLGHLKQPQKEVQIESGQSYYGLLSQYQRSVPMFSAKLAKLYIKTNVDAPLRAGSYMMPENPTLIDMIDALQQDPVTKTVVVQIIEGKTAADLYKTLAHTSGIKLEVLDENGQPQPNLKQALGIDAITPKGKYSHNLEGWFTPNTYHYPEGTTDKQVLIDLYNNQQQVLADAWKSRSKDLPYSSPYEALIMASIIEKETSVPSERALVASVFVNRLNQGMRLQTDPTIIYGMSDRYNGDIRRKDINEKTDYNTYQIDGLPPTPIALPSPDSIHAALHPEKSDALYFVATGTGGHKFSKTLSEHNKAVQDYLKVIREKQ